MMEFFETEVRRLMLLELKMVEKRENFQILPSRVCLCIEVLEV